MGAPEGTSGIRLMEVRIRNFRSLREVDVKLDPLVVLIGENNAGKTSFLDALHAAIGAGRRVLSEDDICLAPDETVPPNDRPIIIDILVRPTDEEGAIATHFPSGSFWLGLWGTGISQDENDDDFVAFRTEMKWDEAKGEYVTERKFLGEWLNDPSRWADAKVNEKAGRVWSPHIEPLALYYMDAKRDIEDELRNPGSFWHRLIKDPQLDSETASELEQSLTELNAQIVSGSPVLAHIEQHLKGIDQTLVFDRGSISVTPLARTLRDLSRGVDVDFATSGGHRFPIIRHGMGTRSLAAVLTFRAYATWKQQRTNTEETHSVLALEEPEVHLHPQAQRSLFRQIEKIPGQRVVSTHSPYIAGQAHISSFRLFSKRGAETVVNQVDVSNYSREDIAKINRMVVATRGDLLYARAIILFEGQTEKEAFPVFAEHYWSRPPDDLGIELVPVDGYSNYLPFLRLASDLGLEWYLFSDGETAAVTAVERSLRRIGIENIEDCDSLVVLPEGCSFETYLMDEGYEDAVSKMLDQYHKTTNFIGTQYTPKHNGLQRKGGEIRDYNGRDGRKAALTDILCENKTKYAKCLATTITQLQDESRQIPQKLRVLFDQVSRDLNLT